MIDRIAILGGSSVYIPEFVLSVISHNLNIREIALLGRDPRKLEIVSSFCQRLLDRSGFPCTIVPTTDICEAVTGAKYILNHIRVGGMKQRLQDEKLPIKFGMIGNDCLGAGGITSALRTLPVILDLSQKIEKVSPDATLINLTNPMGIVMEALVRHSNLRAIGVSDLPGTYVRKIAKLMRVDHTDLDVNYVGLNHMGWIQDIRLDGASVMPQLLDTIIRETPEDFDMGLVELFRMIPTRHVSLYFHRDTHFKEQSTSGRVRAEVLYEAEQQILKLYEDPSLTEVPDLTRQRNALWYEETILPMIKALEFGAERPIICCIQNGEAIRDLPANCSVEVPVRVGQGEFEARQVGNCPRFLKGLFITVKECDSLVVKAVKHKSYEYALQALAINPLVPSLETAKRYLDTVMKEESLDLH